MYDVNIDVEPSGRGAGGDRYESKGCDAWI